jgi:hypothetical protein
MTEHSKMRDLSRPHPLAPVGSPTLAEEQAEHARQLEEQNDVRNLERRQDRLLSSIDSVFELINDEVLPAIKRMEVSSAEVRVEQTVMITAVNRMADRVDAMGKIITEIDTRVVGLERVSEQRTERFNVLDARVTTIEQEVAELKPRQKTKAKRKARRMPRKTKARTRRSKA